MIIGQTFEISFPLFTTYYLLIVLNWAKKQCNNDIMVQMSPGNFCWGSLIANFNYRSPWKLITSATMCVYFPDWPFWPLCCFPFWPKFPGHRSLRSGFSVSADLASREARQYNTIQRRKNISSFYTRGQESVWPFRAKVFIELKLFLVFAWTF